MKRITLGSDIEFFVADKQGEIVSAEGFVPGTKQEPYRYDEAEPGFATQLDNVLAEGNIPPATSPYEFVEHLRRLREHLDGILKPHGLHTVAQAAARLDPKYLETPHAKQFGCDPSYNCWTLEPEPVNAGDHNLRSAGFHIHIGYKTPQPEINIALMRLLDAYIGLHSVGVELKSERRELGYGKAGNFRNQPHGVEYRTLSSGMYQHAYWASSRVSSVAGYFLDLPVASMTTVMKTLTKMGDDIQGAINTHDERKAKKLRDRLNVSPIVQMIGVAF